MKCPAAVLDRPCPLPPPPPSMASRDSEPRRSMGPPMAVKAVTADGVQANKRGPNPQTDYKRHFNRTKERFDLVTAVSGVSWTEVLTRACNSCPLCSRSRLYFQDQTARKKELDRASMKQAKLQEELE